MTSTPNIYAQKSWDELYNLQEPLNFDEFLQSDLLSSKRRHNAAISIIRPISGSISLISSVAIIYHLYKSHNRLSTTNHRLVLGLCVADVLSSFSHVISAIAVPREMKYLFPFSSGNIQSCVFRVALLLFGAICSALYNCSLCLNYLAIIRFNKTDQFIEKKLEIWLHGIPVIIPLLINLILAPYKVYNNSGREGPFCFVQQYNPPHCIGHNYGSIPEYFHTPCGRGQNVGKPIVFITFRCGQSLALFVTPSVIIFCMAVMYRSVSIASRCSFRMAVGIQLL